MESLWPTKEEIFSSEKDSPKNILIEQVNILNKNFSEINAEVIPDVRLDGIPVSDMNLILPKASDSALDFNASMNLPIYYRLIISSKIANYRVEIMKIKQYIRNSYPADIIDCVNEKTYTVGTKEQLSNKLRLIFNSDRVKTTLRNLLKLSGV